MKKIRVAHLTSVHSVEDNRIFYKECKTLARQEKYEVYLICAGAKSRFNEGIRIIGYPKAKNIIKRMIKTSFIDMIQYCLKIKADIYHFHDPELIIVGILLKILGKKVIYDIHENNPADLLNKPYIKNKLIRKIISFLFDKFEKFIVKYFDAIIVARPDIKTRIKHQNLVVLRNYPKLSSLKQIQNIYLDKNRPSLIYVGGINKIRGIEILLEAFKQLDSYELWLLGPITEKSIKKKLEISTNVKYLGIVKPDRVYSYIIKADAGIITFLPAPNHNRTLATKPFEYMACGKPIIMSNFPYWKKKFKDGAIYVNPNDPEEIANAIKKLFNNKEKMIHMGKLNKKLVIKKFNWEKESIKLISLYERLIFDDFTITKKGK